MISAHLHPGETANAVRATQSTQCCVSSLPSFSGSTQLRIRVEGIEQRRPIANAWRAKGTTSRRVPLSALETSSCKWRAETDRAYIARPIRCRTRRAPMAVNGRRGCERLRLPPSDTTEATFRTGATRLRTIGADLATGECCLHALCGVVASTSAFRAIAIPKLVTEPEHSPISSVSTRGRERDMPGFQSCLAKAGA
jgi:hypothetical protein